MNEVESICITAAPRPTIVLSESSDDSLPSDEETIYHSSALIVDASSDQICRDWVWDGAAEAAATEGATAVTPEREDIAVVTPTSGKGEPLRAATTAPKLVHATRGALYDRRILGAEGTAAVKRHDALATPSAVRERSMRAEGRNPGEDTVSVVLVDPPEKVTPSEMDPSVASPRLRSKPSHSYSEASGGSNGNPGGGNTSEIEDETVAPGASGYWVQDAIVQDDGSRGEESARSIEASSVRQVGITTGIVDQDEEDNGEEQGASRAESVLPAAAAVTPPRRSASSAHDNAGRFALDATGGRQTEADCTEGGMQTPTQVTPPQDSRTLLTPIGCAGETSHDEGEAGAVRTPVRAPEVVVTTPLPAAKNFPADPERSRHTSGRLNAAVLEKRAGQEASTSGVVERDEIVNREVEPHGEKSAALSPAQVQVVAHTIARSPSIVSDEATAAAEEAPSTPGRTLHRSRAVGLREAEIEATNDVAVDVVGPASPSSERALHKIAAVGVDEAEAEAEAAHAVSHAAPVTERALHRTSAVGVEEAESEAVDDATAADVSAPIATFLRRTAAVDITNSSPRGVAQSRANPLEATRVRDEAADDGSGEEVSVSDTATLPVSERALHRADAIGVEEAEAEAEAEDDVITDRTAVSPAMKAVGDAETSQSAEKALQRASTVGADEAEAEAAPGVKPVMATAARSERILSHRIRKIGNGKRERPTATAAAPTAVDAAAPERSGVVCVSPAAITEGSGEEVLTPASAAGGSVHRADEVPAEEASAGELVSKSLAEPGEPFLQVGSTTSAHERATRTADDSAISRMPEKDGGKNVAEEIQVEQAAETAPDRAASTRLQSPALSRSQAEAEAAAAMPPPPPPPPPPQSTTSASTREGSSRGDSRFAGEPEILVSRSRSYNSAWPSSDDGESPRGITVEEAAALMGGTPRLGFASNTTWTGAGMTPSSVVGDADDRTWASIAGARDPAFDGEGGGSEADDMLVLRSASFASFVGSEHFNSRATQDGFDDSSSGRRRVSARGMISPTSFVSVDVNTPGAAAQFASTSGVDDFLLADGLFDSSRYGAGPPGAVFFSKSGMEDILMTTECDGTRDSPGVRKAVAAAAAAALEGSPDKMRESAGESLGRPSDGGAAADSLSSTGNHAHDAGERKRVKGAGVPRSGREGEGVEDASSSPPAAAEAAAVDAAGLVTERPATSVSAPADSDDRFHGQEGKEDDCAEEDSTDASVDRDDGGGAVAGHPAPAAIGRSEGKEGLDPSPIGEDRPPSGKRRSGGGGGCCVVS